MALRTTEPDDPWAHRSGGMRCRTCMFFVLKGSAAQMDRNEEEKTGGLGPSPIDRGLLGRCRRRAPTMAGFPAVFQSDWCGEHKLDENKA